MDENKTVICPSCGTEHPEGTMFCNECGARLDEGFSETAVPSDSTPEDIPVLQVQEDIPVIEEVTPVIPVAEEHKETKKEARQREKAEKEAAKLQAKIDKKAVKMAEKAARKAERRKRNIWAIFLMIIFFAGMCYAGWNLWGQYNENKALNETNETLTEQNEELQEEVDTLSAKVEEQDQTIAKNAEDFQAEKDSSDSQIDELSEKLVGAEEKIEQLQGKLDECEEKVGAYDELIKALGAENIGYYSEKLYADNGIVMMKSSAVGYDVEIFCDGKIELAAESGDTYASAELTDGDHGEKYVSITPIEEGVAVFKIGNKKGDIMRIVVLIVE